MPLMAHIDHPPPSYEHVISRLRPGDVLTHAFRPFPNSAATAQGTVKPEVIAARKRGVLFDIGHGKGSFAFKTARAMLANGFEPDTISSDVHTLCINGPAFDQVTTLSKFLCLGMPLERVIAASTVNAAMALKRPELGIAEGGLRRRCHGAFDQGGQVRLCGRHRRAYDGRQAHSLARRRDRRQMVAPQTEQQVQEDRRMSAEDKLKAMGLTLPATPKPLANYVSFKRVGRARFPFGPGPALSGRLLRHRQGRARRDGRAGL